MSARRVTVWRLEFHAPDHPNHGRGPFVGYHSHSNELDNSEGYKLPSPIRDGASKEVIRRLYDGELMCAVRYKKELRRWFVGDLLDKLIDIGFVVKRYKIREDKIIVLSHQVLIERKIK